VKRKTSGMFAVAFLIIGAFAVGLFSNSYEPKQPQQQPLDFTVTQTNDCLRFLERTVKLCYTPFNTGAGEQWRLTVECLKMPGSVGWTDLYVYNGYWDAGADHLCTSEDLYPIVSDIPASDFRMNINNTFSQVFGEVTPRSYTVFFVFPPGGEGSFHVNLEKVN
jgi:hypothetical protein